MVWATYPSLQCFPLLPSLLPPVSIPLSCQISVAHLHFQGQANCTLSIFIQYIRQPLGKYVWLAKETNFSPAKSASKYPFSLSLTAQHSWEDSQTHLQLPFYDLYNYCFSLWTFSVPLLKLRCYNVCEKKIKQPKTDHMQATDASRSLPKMLIITAPLFLFNLLILIHLPLFDC